MNKKLSINYSITYNFKGQLLKDYLDWLDDYEDTKAARKWFAIDRFIGHDNLALFDSKGKLAIKESDSDFESIALEDTLEAFRIQRWVAVANASAELTQDRIIRIIESGKWVGESLEEDIAELKALIKGENK